MIKLKASIALIILLLHTTPSCAEVKLATLFRDGVVLQRDKSVAIWGTADAGESVIVEFCGQMKTATPNVQGQWLLHLDPLKASATPDRLTARGKNSLSISGVLVGDVWLCSGQSNMNLPLSATKDAKQEISRANFPLIHYFDVKASILEEPADDAEGAWQVCTPETAGGFTAVGYYFARELQPKVGVPIGIIKASLGGSPIEGWIGADVFASTPAAIPAFKEWERIKAGYIQRADEYKVNLAAWKSRNAAALAAGQPPSEAKPVRAWLDSDRNKPSGLYNGFIHPLEPYALAGFVWYQGEGNVPRAAEYKVLFPLMIEQWRRDFKQPDLPFLFVQLPNFKQLNDATGQSWAWLRDAQAAAQALPHVGMAVTIDIGDPVDLHPGNKRDVGQRLASIANHQIYGGKEQDSGPIHTQVMRNGKTIHVRFANSEGLSVHGDPTNVFVIAGVDRKFVPAQVQISGDTAIVSAPSVKSPVAVRLEWTNNPQAWLVNESGLPAAPFRSDDW